METEILSVPCGEKKEISTSQKAWKYIRDCISAHSADLNRPAIADGSRSFTYGLMFREWERYAAVFSALGMTEERHSRVGIMGSVSAEVIFSVYGLNMVGAEVSIVAGFRALKPNVILKTIRDEKLTDFIVTDDFAQPYLLNELLGRKDELGLRNVILLHLPVSGSTADPMMSAMQEAKYLYYKQWYAPICMDILLDIYGSRTVSYASDESTANAIILHSTGTTSGTGKPIPLSDEAFNSVNTTFRTLAEIDAMSHDSVSSVIVDLSNSYSIMDQVHGPLSLGGMIVIVSGGAMNPMYYNAIPEFGMTFLFAISAMLDQWLKLPETTKFDFSTLRYVVLGGSSVPAKAKKRYLDFFRRHGNDNITLLVGYGISELGGACILSTPEPDDESIGYPMQGVDIRLIDEENDKVMTLQDAPCEGILYMNSICMATPELDGKTVIESREIDGRKYLCTNDLVRAETDGRITFLGRANRYFINDKGIKYDSGRVETEMMRQTGIESCAMVPVYHKVLHDNIPMLCVKLLETDSDPQKTILAALREVFIANKTLSQELLPYRVMIVDELPRNVNGKVDTFKISRGEVEGDVFELKPVRIMGQLTDIKLAVFDAEASGDMLKEVFSEIAGGLKDDILMNKSSADKKDSMKDPNPAATGFRAMNEVGRLFMNLVYTEPSCMSMPCMQQMMQNTIMNMMPDMRQMMNNVMPNMQQMLWNMGQHFFGGKQYPGNTNG